MPIWDVNAAGTVGEIGSAIWDVNAAGTATGIQHVWDVTAAGTSSKVWDSALTIPAYSYTAQYPWVSAATKTLLATVYESTYYNLSSFSSIAGSASASYSMSQCSMPYGIECYFVLCLETNGTLRELAGWNAARYATGPVVSLGGSYNKEISSWTRTSCRFAIRVYGQSYNGDNGRIDLTNISRAAATAQ